MAKKKLTIDDVLVPKDEIPYDVPDNWYWVKWNYILNDDKYSMKRGPFGSSLKKAFFVEKGENTYKVYEQKNAIYNDNTLGEYYIDEEKYNELIAFKVEESDLIISCSGTLGRISEIKEGFQPGVINQALLKLKLNNNIITNDYFIHLFRSSEFQEKILNKSQGSAIVNMMSVKELKELPIPLPPLAEQVRIVNRIESLFDKVDKAAGLVDEARDGFEKRRAAILERAFCGELTKKWREENGVSDEWEVVSIKDVLSTMTTKKPNQEDETFRYIDIDAIDNKRQEVREPKVLAVSKAPSRASREVRDGDTLFSLVRPYLKNIAYISDEYNDCIASTGFYVCRPSDRILPKYLYNILCSDKTINFYTSMMKGDNSPSIRKGEFESLEIELPTIQEQKEIIKRVDKLIETERNIEDISDLSELIELTKKSILAKAFRGELKSNNINENKSSELIIDLLLK